jgi:hypothetical protein
VSQPDMAQASTVATASERVAVQIFQNIRMDSLRRVFDISGVTPEIPTNELLSALRCKAEGPEQRNRDLMNCATISANLSIARFRGTRPKCERRAADDTKARSSALTNHVSRRDHAF